VSLVKYEWLSNQKRAPAPTQRPRGASTRRVAVVDDDAAVCNGLRFLLEAHGFSVRTYADGAEFLRDNSDIVCLVVDYLMPGLNGLEVSKRYRQAAGRDTPIILMTSASNGSIASSVAELGIAHVIQKPLGTALIEAVCQELACGDLDGKPAQTAKQGRSVTSG
jgi:two-component system, LuxR family, response regulator FixJ